MTKNTISLTTKLAIVDFLRTVCHKDGELSYYDNGLSDRVVAERIAELRQEPITYHNVRNIREEVLGRLKPQPKPPVLSSDLGADIVRHLLAVEDKLDQLITHFVKRGTEE